MKNTKKQIRKKYKKDVKDNLKYAKHKTYDKRAPKLVNLNHGTCIEARNIWKIAAIKDKRYELVKDVSLSIKQGDFIIIFGESGSGKTTLLSMLSGLERPSEGNVNILNYNTTALKNHELTTLRRNYIGYIFQQYGLLKDVSVLENILVADNKYSKHQMSQTHTDSLFSNPNELFRIKTKYSTDVLENMHEHLKVIKEKFLENILNELEIKPILNTKIELLSGGQQQRVSIARAIVKCPKILFADEPTGAVDAQTAKTIMKLFVDLNKNYNTTIIMVSHNQNLLKLASRVITLADGKIVKDEINSNRLNIKDIDFA